MYQCSKSESLNPDVLAEAIVQTGVSENVTINTSEGNRNASNSQPLLASVQSPVKNIKIIKLKEEPHTGKLILTPELQQLLKPNIKCVGSPVFEKSSLKGETEISENDHQDECSKGIPKPSDLSDSQTNLSCGFAVNECKKTVDDENTYVQSCISDGKEVWIENRYAGESSNSCSTRENSSVTEKKEDKQYSSVYEKKSGQKRKERLSVVEDGITHICERVVKTKTRTVLLKGECECIPLESEDEGSDVFMEDREGEEIPKKKKRPITIRRVGKRKPYEGNMDMIDDYVTQSCRIRNRYKRWRKNRVVDGKEVLPDYKVKEKERRKQQKQLREKQFRCTFRSWDDVMNCKEQVEVETRTKFILYSRSPGFNDKEPPKKKKIVFELRRSKGSAAIVPYNGIPLMWLGQVHYRCHLGKDNNRAKKEKYKMQRLYLEEHGVVMKRRKSQASKKIGCPATFAITKVARFPDFRIDQDVGRGQKAVSQELRKAWTEDASRVRYYIEYHVKVPTLEDHKGHDWEEKDGCDKFKEPVDPMLLEKIYDLTRKGIVGMKTMKEELAAYVRNDLFKGQEPPTHDRRRYYPSDSDIRNAMQKINEEARGEQGFPVW
ncbi:uncharacterized protein LOC143020335 isoform X2 [Oratosquilla oratoria]|uniref:uncharacterized protein LOC143020335 isoform X2 n=1 Tax=Oratosquilla oratoria TaxID=337810 RepID=UPI003F75D40F